MIKQSQPRTKIRVTFPNSLILEGPKGTTVEAFLIAAQEIQPGLFDSPFMGAICDMKLRELSFPLVEDTTVEAVLLSSSDGGRIYRRSLVMLMTAAIKELWPDTRVNVSYAVPDGGFYCQVANRPPLSVGELEQLQAHMLHIIQANDPITKQVVHIDEARKLFADRHELDKVRLLEQRVRDDLTLYTLRSYTDYYFGYMVPSTRYLPYFRLIPVNDGFILQYPRSTSPTHLGEMMPYSKLTEIFHLADHWLQRMGIEDVGRLNRLVRQNQVAELILVAEALHEQRIAYIATEICRMHETRGVQIVLIAGPSSSGKTTFSKRLAIQLLAHGLRPFTLELDNYFVDRHLTPIDEHGNYDFEALAAVNLDLFNRHLLQIMAGEEVRLPRFDFVHGKSEEGALVQLRPDQIIIIEGIHGLNPGLVPAIPPEAIYRIYVSALTQLNIDSHNRVPTTDVRLFRRIVRDASHRGNSATATLERWQSVRRGEKRNIFPYQENADAMFNSALVYELAALRPQVEPLLLQVRYGTRAHIEANRLLSFLN